MPFENQLELEDWAREMLVAARVARLGLLDDEDRPRVLPVTFALVGDLAWSAIDHKPKRSDASRPGCATCAAAPRSR